MPRDVWVGARVVTLFCTLTFAALGVFVGYVVPGGERHAGPRPRAGAARPSSAGVFIPLDQYTDVVRHVAYWTPMYGVSEIARAPLTHDAAVVRRGQRRRWFGLFVAGAAWRMSKDTARV